MQLSNIHCTQIIINYESCYLIRNRFLIYTILPFMEVNQILEFVFMLYFIKDKKHFK